MVFLERQRDGPELRNRPNVLCFKGWALSFIPKSGETEFFHYGIRLPPLDLPPSIQLQLLFARSVKTVSAVVGNKWSRGRDLCPLANEALHKCNILLSRVVRTNVFASGSLSQHSSVAFFHFRKPPLRDPRDEVSIPIHCTRLGLMKARLRLRGNFWKALSMFFPRFSSPGRYDKSLSINCLQGVQNPINRTKYDTCRK
ncbi:hypothetical protein QTP88_023511 [Uroleucon formosanum]